MKTILPKDLVRQAEEMRGQIDLLITLLNELIKEGIPCNKICEADRLNVNDWIQEIESFKFHQ